MNVETKITEDSPTEPQQEPDKKPPRGSCGLINDYIEGNSKVILGFATDKGLGGGFYLHPEKIFDILPQGTLFYLSGNPPKLRKKTSPQKLSSNL